MYRLLRVLSLAPFVVACATSDGGATVDGAVNPTADAMTVIDGAISDPDASPAIDASADAPVVDAALPPDAMVDAMVDAALPPDAMVDAALPPDAMVDAALPPDAMVDAMLPPDACVPDWTNLLNNGNFEQMATSWTQTGTVIREFGNGYPWPTFDGDWAALFGGVNSASQTLTQQVTVPAGATMLRLRGQLCFVTQETTTTTVYDTLTVQVQGGVIEEYVFSNLDAGSTCSWAGFTLNAPTAHAGETITLSFAAATDTSLITSFGLDALVLEAFACP